MARSNNQARKLTDKAVLFIVEYLKDMNGAAAAIRAGYAPKRAEQTAYLLLRDPRIKAEIDKELAARVTRTKLEADEVLMQIAHAVRLDPRKLVHPVTGRPLGLHELDDATAAAVSGFEYDELTGKTKIRFVPKMEAIEKAMKHMGLYERDNKQKADSEIAQLMAAIHGANPRLRVKDDDGGKS